MGDSTTIHPPPGAGIPALRYRSCLNTTSNISLAFCGNETAPDEEETQQSLQLIQKIVAIVVPLLFGLIVMVGLIGNALMAVFWVVAPCSLVVWWTTRLHQTTRLHGATTQKTAIFVLTAVVLVVAANQQMRSTTNLLIINLAVADLLFIVFCVPFTATDYVLPFWPFGDIWCKTVQYLIVVTAYASVYTLVLMSLDRFLAVVHPITSMSIRTERNAFTAIGVTWIVILLVSMPVYVSHGEVTYTYSSAEHTACVFLEQDAINRPDGYNKPIFQILFFATSYVTPLALICGLYLCMLLRLWHGVAPGGHVSAESRRGKKRVTRMVVVVVAIFAICWFPIQIILVLKSIDKYEITNTSVMIQIVSQVMAYMNSCVNPILYAFLSDHFRKAFRKVVNCGPRGSRGTRYQRASTTIIPHQANGRCDGSKSTMLTVTKTTRTNGCSAVNDIL